MYWPQLAGFVLVASGDGLGFAMTQSWGVGGGKTDITCMMFLRRLWHLNPLGHQG